MAARKKRLKKSFKFFVAFFVLIAVILSAFIIIKFEKKAEVAPPILDTTDELVVKSPEIVIKHYNEFIDVEVTEGIDVYIERPILKGYDQINEQVTEYVNLLGNDVRVDCFFNQSYYSLIFDGKNAINFDVKTNEKLQFSQICAVYYAEYGDVEFSLDEYAITLYIEGGTKTIPFSEYGGRKYLPYTPPKYSPVKDDEKVIALTFDDGPRRPEITAVILDKLIERRAKATFFVLGRECPSNGDTLKRIVETGNEIGNHSYHHERLNKITRKAALDTINNTQKIIYEKTGVYPIIMRPPYGDERTDIIKEVGLFNVNWSIDPEDWKTKDAKAIVDHVRGKLQSGMIVLMHDVYDTSAQAACEIIDMLSDDGWRLVTVSELFDLENRELTTDVLRKNTR